MLLCIYIYDLIDCPSNELVYDRTGFLKHFQMQLQSIRAHVMLEVRVQVYANVNIYARSMRMTLNLRDHPHSLPL